MSFKLRAGQSLRKDLRRVMRKQIEGAIKDLSKSQGPSRDEAVHDTRKALKKVRAVLRLTRPGIGRRDYRQGNAALRDAARPLTEVRDAKILIETIDKLAATFKENVAGRTFGNVRNALESHFRSTRQRVLNEEHTLAKVQRTLKGLQPRIAKWGDVPNKWSSIGDGLIDTYRKASDAFGDAAVDAVPEKLHEWRKQAKYLRYQLELLQPIWQERMEEIAGEADQMGELLGDDHDLTLLRQMLTTNENLSRDHADVDLLLALIEHRQKQLRKEVMILGERFFEEPPSDFTRRLKRYWRTWRAASNSQLQVAVRAGVA